MIIKLVDNLLNLKNLSRKILSLSKEERLLRFFKQIEKNLMICPKETEDAGNRSKMGRGGSDLLAQKSRL